MRAVIFANGDPALPHDIPGALNADDLLIAADGGAKHWLDLHIIPDVVIGDLDSLEPSMVEHLREQGAKVISYPADKDQTDLELAILYAKEAGADQIAVLGGLGGRWDHSLANLFLPTLEAFSELEIIFMYNEDRLFVIRDSIDLGFYEGHRVSLIPLFGDSRGVKTEGLAFPLNKETLPLGTSRGVSNVVKHEPARVSLESGLLLCVISPAKD